MISKYLKIKNYYHYFLYFSISCFASVLHIYVKYKPCGLGKPEKSYFLVARRGEDALPPRKNIF